MRASGAETRYTEGSTIDEARPRNWRSATGLLATNLNQQKGA